MPEAAGLGWTVRLHCNRVAPERIQVQWKYPSATWYEQGAPKEFETRGTLMLRPMQLTALVVTLRRGGMKVVIAGPYMNENPSLQTIEL